MWRKWESDWSTFHFVATWIWKLLSVSCYPLWNGETMYNPLVLLWIKLNCICKVVMSRHSVNVIYSIISWHPRILSFSQEIYRLYYVFNFFSELIFNAISFKNIFIFLPMQIGILVASFNHKANFTIFNAGVLTTISAECLLCYLLKELLHIIIIILWAYKTQISL